MKALILSLGFLLVGCTTLVSFTHPDHIACGRRGKAYEVRPELYLHLGNAPQVCAGRDGLAKIILFVNLYNLPPQEVRFLINEKHEVRMFGKDLELTLQRVKVGQHSVVVSTTGALDGRLSWSVWDCGV